MDQRNAMQQTPLQLYRTGDRLVVAAPMPGLGLEDILVEVRPDGHLALHGLFGEGPADAEEVFLDEWAPGPYHREVALPAAVDGERARTSYRNGVLVVEVPLAERTRPARLDLAGGTQASGADDLRVTEQMME